MYSFTGRINYFVYSGIFCLVIAAALNHIVARFGYLASPNLGVPV